MNYVELVGGLGNQLFGYAFSKYCEKVSGNLTLLYTNFFDYVRDDPEIINRNYGLSRFEWDIVTIKGTVSCSQILNEKDYRGINPGDNNILFRGYWHRKEFVEALMSDPRQNLRIRESYITEELLETANEISKQNAVVVHVRGGDYLKKDNKQIFYSLDRAYYEKSLEMIRERGGSDPTIYVFTDDEKHAIDVIGESAGAKVRWMTGRTDYEDLYLMTLARHHIIANSSFSWWGAAMSDNRDGITIAPKNWFRNMPAPDLYPDDWIVI